MSDEVVILSSDDETNSICKLTNTTDDDSQSTVNSDINALIDKYKSSTYIKYKSKPLETISSSSSDEDDTIESLRNKINSNTNLPLFLQNDDFNSDILKEKNILG